MVGMSRLLAENASHHDMLTDLRAGSASIAKTSLREVTPRQPANQPGDPLTKREHAVLTLVAQGLTDHGIAERDSSAPPGPPPDHGAGATESPGSTTVLSLNSNWDATLGLQRPRGP